MLVSGKWVNFGSDESTEVSLAWNQYYPIASCFETCAVQRFHLCARDQFCILPRMKKSMALFHIKSFSCHVTILLKRKLQHVGHKWVTSGLFCGLVCQMSQQVWPTFNPVSYGWYFLSVRWDSHLHAVLVVIRDEELLIFHHHCYQVNIIKLCIISLATYL